MMARNNKRVLVIAAFSWIMLALFSPKNILYSIKYKEIPFSQPYFKNRDTDENLQGNYFTKFTDTEDYLIDTPGCSIPNYTTSMIYKDPAYTHSSCAVRIVFIKRITFYYLQFIKFSIKRLKFHGTDYLFECCYKFAALESIQGGKAKLSYSTCKSFKNGSVVKQDEEVIVVTCVLSSKTNNTILFTYEDSYILLMKKITVPVDTEDTWNMLLVGLDTMSRGRAYHSLPETVNYLRNLEWLDYRAYHKVGSNTLPNLMSLLTGKNFSIAHKICLQTTDECNDLFIWNRYKEAGYVTAYGEDHIQLPDTFSGYRIVNEPPTDHIARPLFLTGEHRSGNILCTKSKLSGVCVLDYATQFAHAYKKDSFFGLFWINSFSHNAEHFPRLFERHLIEFFEDLREIGVLYNTFVLFMSDHGLRNGVMRMTSASYYDDRLPMLFMWVPHGFREQYPIEYYNLQVNQYRLVTPYDLHATLWKILDLSKSFVDVVPAEACSEVQSLTEEISPLRTCEGACIDEKWCSCHSMSRAEVDSASLRSLDVAVSDVQNISLGVKTVKCFKCSPLKLKSVLRNDWYTRGNKTYYVVAFVLSPQDLAFEATVEHYEDEFTVLPPTNTIVPYNTRGYCVLNRADQPYCSCVSIKNCKRNNG